MATKNIKVDAEIHEKIVEFCRIHNYKVGTWASWILGLKIENHYSVGTTNDNPTHPVPIKPGNCYCQQEYGYSGHGQGVAGFNREHIAVLNAHVSSSFLMRE